MRYQDEYPDEIERIKARKDRARLEEIRRQEKYRQQGQINDHISIYEPKADEFKTVTKKKKKKRRKKIRLLILELLILCLISAGIWYYINTKSDTGYWTVAVFGVDSRDGNLGKGALSDVEMICNINKESGEIQLVSVYRDTYVQINSEGTYHKINEAYFKGGYEQALYALNTNLDLNITDYATFNWTAVVNAINILGGVDIDITDKEFEYINSFITETVNSTGVGSFQLEHAGMNHLDGVQAVAYSRLRLMDTDYKRTERQRKIVSLAFEKAKSADPVTLVNLVQAVFSEVKTNVGIDDLLPMAKNIRKYHLGETTGFPFTKSTAIIGKKDCVIPLTLESNVEELHRFLYPDTTYAVSSKLKSISHKISVDSGLGDVVNGGPVSDKHTEAESSVINSNSTAQTQEQINNSPENHTTDDIMNVDEATYESESDTADISDITENDINNSIENEGENDNTEETNVLENDHDADDIETETNNSNNIYGPNGGPGVSETNEPEITKQSESDPRNQTKEIGPGVN